MKLHDLHPAPGSRKKRIRVGRGIAAGGGKTAGRGTKGQKARAGGSIPPWFEGGQTPLHQRIPKLRGFKNPFKTEYEVVNLGRIATLIELGTLETGELPGGKKAAGSGSSKAAPITVNQELLRAAGVVRTLDKPLKILGNGEIETALFVVADKFSKTAIAKIEAAGGSVQILEIPTTPLKALGLDGLSEASVAVALAELTADDDNDAETDAAAEPTAKAPVDKAATAAKAATAPKASAAKAAAKAKPAVEAKAAPAAKTASAKSTPAKGTAKAATPAKAAKLVKGSVATDTSNSPADDAGSAPEPVEAPAGEDA
jgi:large subunit ribosomal protein L15